MQQQIKAPYISPEHAAEIIINRRPLGRFITKTDKWFTIDNTKGQARLESFETYKIASQFFTT